MSRKKDLASPAIQDSDETSLEIRVQKHIGLVKD
ncbi:hypothetical protein SCNU_08498 [Gordonia neofelifaecis NRRL B-59395]|uniref:Uncharacterized protein n=1 Tax=Gordonia neofelifaecis NRRL B-59395 TaxID=644548 RepID=F1YHT5_9ACTN|nr:hypothetical protein SCNU_08498 [Gordonia neofelifaecis NRRL B-59395]